MENVGMLGHVLDFPQIPRGHADVLSFLIESVISTGQYRDAHEQESQRGDENSYVAKVPSNLDD